MFSVWTSEFFVFLLFTPSSCFWTTLRKRLKRSSRYDSFLSPNTVSSPLDPIDLEANSTTSESTSYFQTSSFEAARDIFQRHPATWTPKLEPEHHSQHPTLSATVPLLVLSACLVIMFIGNPQGMLCTILSILFFAPYPPHFPRWMILIPLLVPMSMQGTVKGDTFAGLDYLATTADVALTGVL